MFIKVFQYKLFMLPPFSFLRLLLLLSFNSSFPIRPYQFQIFLCSFMSILNLHLLNSRLFPPSYSFILQKISTSSTSSQSRYILHFIYHNSSQNRPSRLFLGIFSTNNYSFLIFLSHFIKHQFITQKP